MASSTFKQLLVEEGIKQAAFARAAGVSVGMVNRVCNGKIIPAPTTRNRMIKKLNELTGKQYSHDDAFSARRKSSG